MATLVWWLFLLSPSPGLEVQRCHGAHLHVLRHDADELGRHQHRRRVELPEERLDGHVAHHHGPVGLLHHLRVDAGGAAPVPGQRLLVRKEDAEEALRGACFSLERTEIFLEEWSDVVRFGEWAAGLRVVRKGSRIVVRQTDPRLAWSWGLFSWERTGARLQNGSRSRSD